MTSARRLSRLWQGFPRQMVRAVLTGIRPSRDPAYFSRLYDRDPDPWQFRSSEYEQEKYLRSLEALPPRRFRSAFEVGCSIGVFSHMLASRCDALLGVDIVEQPLHAARAVCAEQPWARFQRMRVPREWPHGIYDLIVLSEVLYFLSKRDVAAVADRARTSLAPTGLVLLVNWRGRTDDPCTGDEAADLFITQTSPWLERRAQHHQDDYRLDLLGRS